MLTVGVANAAVLGGLTATTLGAWNQSATPSTPVILACDNFGLAAATGRELDGRPVQLPEQCGKGTWTSDLGTWTIRSDELRARTEDATASMDAGQTNVSAEATVLNADGKNRVAGVAINHSGSTRVYLVAAISGPSNALLKLVDGSTVTTLASATVKIEASASVRITRNDETVTVSVNGVLAIKQTLAKEQITTLAGGTRVGLYWNSGNMIRFTDVMATTATSP